MNQTGENRGTATLLQFAQGAASRPAGARHQHERGVVLPHRDSAGGMALNKRQAEYWTSTDYSPVKEVVKSSRTGHATNIISSCRWASKARSGRC